MDYILPRGGLTIRIFILAYFNIVIPAFHDLKFYVLHQKKAGQIKTQHTNNQTINESNKSIYHYQLSIYFSVCLSIYVIVYVQNPSKWTLSLSTRQPGWTSPWDFPPFFHGDPPHPQVGPQIAKKAEEMETWKYKANIGKYHV